MNTPTSTQRSSALSFGMTPLSTESTTARATAACAGPNICTACLAPLMVTLLKRIVSGLAGRLGATTASSVVKPSLLLASALAKAFPAGPDLEPMIKSICATSLPSPTSDSPRKKSAAIGGAPVLRERSELRPLECDALGGQSRMTISKEFARDQMRRVVQMLKEVDREVEVPCGRQLAPDCGNAYRCITVLC